ncbi:hypothetical protein HII13_000868 [Brettanomyces bruxellensis]|nr:hypothetical protein HII13_000868 [Brettanomyces bruxellensis]
MICSLSGEPTIHPALSLKSKKVFDKKLIREYVQQNGKDPMTGESMTLSDIIPIEISASDIIKGPRKSNQDSIPSMLAMFQNEWDALTLELFDLRKQDKSGIILSLNEEKSGLKSTVHFVSPDATNIVGVAYLSNKSSGTSESAILVYDNTIAKISKSDGSIHKFLSLLENIIAIAVHPSLPVLISIAQKCFYIYYEKELIYRSSNLSNSAYKCVALHNDGVLAAFGKADASVEIFDICEHRSLLTIMPPVPSEKVSQLYFALNGYWLLIKYGKSLVGIYDLRKGKFEFLLHFPANSPSTPVAMDPSSRILILGPCYAIYEKKTKQWSLPKSLSNLDETNGQHSSLIFTGISGGCYSKYLVRSLLEYQANAKKNEKKLNLSSNIREKAREVSRLLDNKDILLAKREEFKHIRLSMKLPTPRSSLDAPPSQSLLSPNSISESGVFDKFYKRRARSLDINSRHDILQNIENAYGQNSENMSALSASHYPKFSRNLKRPELGNILEIDEDESTQKFT